MSELVVDEQPDGSYLVRVEDKDTFVEFSLTECEVSRLQEAIRDD